jgi:hypothetical protein
MIVLIQHNKCSRTSVNDLQVNGRDNRRSSVYYVSTMHNNGQAKSAKTIMLILLNNKILGKWINGTPSQTGIQGLQRKEARQCEDGDPFTATVLLIFSIVIVMALIFNGDASSHTICTHLLPLFLFGARCCGWRWWREAKGH